MVKISVITINYNEPRLEKTCQSVVEQTYSDFEWIVIDGGSQAESLKILNMYHNRMDYFISEKDDGIYDAMNKGIKQAHGEFVVFMNAGDCFYDSATLTRVAQYLDVEQGDVFYGDAVMVMADGSVKYKCLPSVVDVRFFIQDCINHQSAYIRRELFDMYGLYDENYKIVSDWKKWLEFSRNGVRFVPLSFLCSFYGYDGISALDVSHNRQERQSILDKYHLKLDPSYCIQTLFSFPASLDLLEKAVKPQLLLGNQLGKRGVKISVIVPVYNVAQYLPKCLNSILRQAMNDIEVICLDDGSSDNSLEVLKEYAVKDARVLVYSFPQNVGVANARNWGIKLAQGKYVSFVDSDDVIDTDFLSKLYRQAEDGLCDVVKGSVHIVEFDDKSTDSLMNEKIENTFLKKQFLGLAWQHEFWSALYKKDFLLRANIEFPLLTNGEDIVFILRVLRAKPKFSLVNDAFYTYFKRAKGASFDVSFKAMQNVLEHFNLSIEMLEPDSLSKRDYETYCQYNIIENIINYWWPHVFVPHCGEEELQFLRQKINFIIKKMGCFDALLTQYAAFYESKGDICLQLLENYRLNKVYFFLKFVPLLRVKATVSKKKIFILGIPYSSFQRYSDKTVIKTFFYMFKKVKISHKTKYYCLGLKVWHKKYMKVFVSGCFDMLHSGHIRFFEEAAQYGDLYVSIGSDKTVEELKHRKTLYTENERLYMVSAIRYVYEAFVAKGSGKLDFAEEIKRIKPDIFFVNADGDSTEKRQFIENLGIRYMVSNRIPKGLLPERSTTAIRAELHK